MNQRQEELSFVYFPENCDDNACFHEWTKEAHTVEDRSRKRIRRGWLSPLPDRQPEHLRDLYVGLARRDLSRHRVPTPAIQERAKY